MSDLNAPVPLALRSLLLHFSLVLVVLFSFFHPLKFGTYNKTLWYRVSNSWFRLKKKERYRPKLSYSSAGFKKKTEANNPRPETRTACLAMMVIIMVESNRWRHTHIVTMVSTSPFSTSFLPSIYKAFSTFHFNYLGITIFWSTGHLHITHYPFLYIFSTSTPHFTISISISKAATKHKPIKPLPLFLSIPLNYCTTLFLDTIYSYYLHFSAY